VTITDQLRRVRCVSEYAERNIGDAELNAIVEAAAWAPSAGDSQPWEIIAVRDLQRRSALVETLLDSLMRPGTGGAQRRNWLCDAPVVLIVCLDHMRAKARYGEIGEKLFGIQDTGAAVQNMRLVALEHQVKSCLIREFDHDALAKLLGLPRHVEPLIMIAMGYSEVEPGQKPRLPLEDYLHHEKW
jgi:nitroreductase